MRGLLLLVLALAPAAGRATADAAPAGSAVTAAALAAEELQAATTAMQTSAITAFTQVSAGASHTCGIKIDSSVVCWGDNSHGRANSPAGAFTQISAGGAHTCGLKSDGSVACWGLNDLGQVTPPAGVFTQISAGAGHTCGVKSDGSVACWGYNMHGQTTVPADAFTQVSAGEGHTCGLKSDGSVACWGRNADGQATPPAGAFTQISAGGVHTCGLKSDGSVTCWGYTADGRTNSPAGAFIQVSAGGSHACGLTSDGSVACWGRNYYGQTTPTGGAFSQVSAGGAHTCGLKSDGSVACWGYNEYGQATPRIGAFRQVSAGGWHTCGVKSDGSVACWGNNYYDRATPPAGAFIQVSAGGEHTCGVKSDGSVTCWGANGYGQATPPAGAFIQVSAGGYHTCGVKSDWSVACWGANWHTQATPLAGAFSQVSAGGEHTCGLKSNGSVACWGHNGNGQATPLAGTFTQVSAGDFHTCALESDGTVACWGYNYNGQTTPPTDVFIQVSARRDHTCGVKSDGGVACWPARFNDDPRAAGAFTQVSAGADHACGLMSDGPLTCWGHDLFSQTTPPTSNPSGPYSVPEGGSLALSASATDFNDYPLAFGWDLDNNGTFETPGPTPTFSAAGRDGPGSAAVGLRVCNSLDVCTTSTVTITITNVGPTAVFTAVPNSPNLIEGSPFTLSLTDATDPSLTDRNAGFTYAFDCGDGAGYSAFSSSNSRSCPTNDNGSRTVKGQVRDKDGGLSPEYVLSVTIYNRAPSASFTVPASVNEGSAITLALTASDPSSVDMASLTYRFDCGNGAGYSPFGASSSHSCATTDNGSRTVKGQVRDKDGGLSPEFSRAVTIANVAPTATFNAPASVPAGTAFTLELTGATEPSPADTAAGFTYAFDCGDGAGYSPFGATSSRGCPTTDQGSRTVRGQVRDKDGGATEYSQTVSVTAPNNPPIANANGPYSVAEGGSVALYGTGSDPAGDPLTFTWDLDDNTVFETTGQNVNFSAANLDGPTSQTVVLKVCDNKGACTTASTSVTITNAAPTATFNAPASVPAGSTFTLELTGAIDPSPADTAAGFSYAFDCGDGTGYRAFGPSNSTTCPTSTAGMRAVKGKVGDKDGGVNEYAASVTVRPPGAKIWLFAEGYTGAGFDQYLTIQNPNDQAGLATITYFLEGAPKVERQVPLPPTSRTTVQVHEPQSVANPGGYGRTGPGQGISARVTSDVNVIVERPMYFAYNGGAGIITGGHNVMGVNAPRQNWLFAEGYTGDGFDQYLTVLNPNSSPAPVAITYFLAYSKPPVTRTLTVPAGSRYTVVVHGTAEGVGRGEAVSAAVTTTHPDGIVVERPMYFTYNGSAGGHNVMGAGAPQPVWYFPDGNTRPGNDEYLTIMNPTTVSANVRLTYYLDGATQERTLTVDRNSRYTVLVHSALSGDNPGGLGRGYNPAVKVESTNGVGLVVERPLYTPTGGDNVMGAPTPSATWLFAEGYTGTGFDESLVVLNPADTNVTVQITYYLEGGGTVLKTIVAPARSRRVVAVNGVSEGVGPGQPVSAKVEGVDGQIVVERTIRFEYQGSIPAPISGYHTVMGYTS